MISWLDKVTNEKVLRRVNEDRQILKSIWRRKRRWTCHILRHDGLLHKIIEQQKTTERYAYLITVIYISASLSFNALNCWLGDRKGIRPLKCWVLVCCW